MSTGAVRCCSPSFAMRALAAVWPAAAAGPTHINAALSAQTPKVKVPVAGAMNTPASSTVLLLPGYASAPGFTMPLVAVPMSDKSVDVPMCVC